MLTTGDGRGNEIHRVDSPGSFDSNSGSTTTSKRPSSTVFFNMDSLSALSSLTVWPPDNVRICGIFSLSPALGK